MTELDKARSHLKLRQITLASRRVNRRPFDGSTLREAECDVIAALAWVWDEQTRAS